MKKERGKKGIKILILLLVLVVPVLITFVVLRLNLDSDLRKGSVSSLTLIYGEQEKTVEKREELEFFISLAESGETIAETANLDKGAKLEGRMMSIFLSPKTGK